MPAGNDVGPGAPERAWLSAVSLLERFRCRLVELLPFLFLAEFQHVLAVLQEHRAILRLLFRNRADHAPSKVLVSHLLIPEVLPKDLRIEEDRNRFGGRQDRRWGLHLHLVILRRAASELLEHRDEHLHVLFRDIGLGTSASGTGPFATRSA